ncbi:hypothetical protein ABZ907_47330 [Nonomuraea wenchangensis]
MPFRLALGWETIQGKPKTEASDRVIALDADTVTALRNHRKAQTVERLAAGEAWVDSGFVFTDEIGRPLHPRRVSDQFYLLSYEAGLPPVRLHDLRHGAASLMLAGWSRSEDRARDTRACLVRVHP